MCQRITTRVIDSQLQNTREQYPKQSPKALLHTILLLRDLEARLAMVSGKGSTVVCNAGGKHSLLQVANTTFNLTLSEGRATNLLFIFFPGSKAFSLPDTNKLQLPIITHMHTLSIFTYCNKIVCTLPAVLH